MLPKINVNFLKKCTRKPNKETKTKQTKQNKKKKQQQQLKAIWVYQKWRQIIVSSIHNSRANWPDVFSRFPLYLGINYALGNGARSTMHWCSPLENITERLWNKHLILWLL